MKAYCEIDGRRYEFDVNLNGDGKTIFTNTTGVTIPAGTAIWIDVTPANLMQPLDEETLCESS